MLSAATVTQSESIQLEDTITSSQRLQASERTIVVGFDGSTASASAVRWAATEADARGAALHVVASYAMPPLMDYFGIGTSTADPAQVQQLHESCKAELAALTGVITAEYPRVAIKAETTVEPATAALVRAATFADLLVVGSNGLGAATGVLLGSVVSSLISKSPCPLTIVPSSTQTDTGRIVVGVDGSVPSRRALEWACNEAELRHCELLVVHAWEYPYQLTNDGIGRGSDIVEADAKALLDAAVESARPCGRVRGELVEGGAAGTLLDAGESADALIVGSRGRGGFRSMLFGSVAHALASHSPCAVVVIH